MVRDVSIVGAGPVGLAVALGLVRAGRTVLVVEKRCPSRGSTTRGPFRRRLLRRLAMLDA